MRIKLVSGPQVFCLTFFLQSGTHILILFPFSSLEITLYLCLSNTKVELGASEL